MTLPRIPYREPVPAAERTVEDWIGVGQMLEELGRGLAAGLGGVETTIDCTPGLEVPGSERSRLARAVARLLARTAAELGSGALELVARPTGSSASPGLMFVVLAVSPDLRTRRDRVAFDPDELALTRELVERGGGVILISRRLPGERSTTLGVESRWRIGRATVLRAVPAPARAAHVSGDSSEALPLRYTAAEIPNSLSR